MSITNILNPKVLQTVIVNTVIYQEIQLTLTSFLEEKEFNLKKKKTKTLLFLFKVN